MSKTRLIFDCPEKNADLFYATRFLAPDDVLFLEHRGKKIFVLSDLEFERGRKEAKVDKVHSLAEWTARARKEGETGSLGVIATMLRHLKVKQLLVPKNTPFPLVDGLRKKGFRIESGGHPFFPQRLIKTGAEKKAMIRCQRAAFQGIALAESILRKSAIRRNFLFWKGKILTSEIVRFEIEKFWLERGFHSPAEPIVASGLQGCDPHARGHGPLRPHQAIVVDLCPRDDESRFFGDATRTFCRGRATPELKRQYKAVQAAQAIGFQKIRHGINGKKVYEAVKKSLEASGYQTKVIDGYKQGMIHGLGHGLGLEIHEEPIRMSSTDFRLEAGHVVTVEPGLYYRKVGGVRIEDIVYVTKRGCEILSGYPRRLEIL